MDYHGIQFESPQIDAFCRRHRLVRVHSAINLDLVWEVLARDLPTLASVLTTTLEREAGAGA